MAAGVAPGGSRRAGRFALFGVAFVLGVTALWWALALWPVPGAPPEWLARARWVCFNVGPSGLPDAGGWLLLVGQPLGLLLVLAIGWGRELRDGMRELRALRAGRALLFAVSLCIALGLGASALRVAQATRFDPRAGAGVADEPLPQTWPRLDRPAPELGLVDQQGLPLDLARLHGRPALVAFAFAHCETVCPALVQQLRTTQARARAEGAPERVPRVAVVTLDPWRDTPSRLPALAERWGLDAGAEAFVLSGAPAEVEAALDRWNVPRARDETTGQVDHPALVYVLDARGRIAFASTGGSAALLELLARL